MLQTWGPKATKLKPMILPSTLQPLQSLGDTPTFGGDLQLSRSIAMEWFLTALTMVNNNVRGFLPAQVVHPIRFLLDLESRSQFLTILHERAESIMQELRFGVYPN